MDPTVSIILCTRNRAESLRHTIQTIGQCQIPANLSAELLVIDNGSTDETAGAIAKLRLPSMPVRYFLEPTPGQSHARNRGLAEAEGEIFLFTDDDVRVPIDWVDGICRPILEGSADAIAGGVRFPVELDDKLRVCRSWFASTEEILPDRPDRFVGANMAFSREVLKHVPAFDVELGPGALGFGDETLFSFQLRQAGFRLTTRFETAVEHHVHPSRLSRKNMTLAAGQMGRSKAYIAYHWHHALISGARGPDRVELAKWWAKRLVPFARVSTAELKIVEGIEISRQNIRQCRGPRNYAKLGLIKLHGQQPILPQTVR
jgi:glycosyltransferase involved in cell wall biosynthesis